MGLVHTPHGCHTIRIRFHPLCLDHPFQEKEKSDLESIGDSPGDRNVSR